jgi:predicted DNA-binding WGR domain protein/cell wall assembly regulator SMI1
MERFECSEGTSHKFWEVKQTGAILSVRWGRIGTAGQSKDKTFATEALAREARERLVREKTREGYTAVATSSGATPEPRASPADASRVATGGFDVAALWSRIEGAAAAQGRPLRMRPGASEKAVAEAEKAMGLAFPPDFRASLLVHDGEERPEWDGDNPEWIPGHPPLAPLAEIVREWKDGCAYFEKYERDRTPGVIERGRLYDFMAHPKRIPIAGNRFWDQDNTYLDLIPGPKGVAGQVVAFGKGVFGLHCGESFGAMLAQRAAAVSRPVKAPPTKTRATATKRPKAKKRPAARAATKKRR